MRIASWNVEGRLSPTGATSRGTPLKVVDHILSLDADVVYLAEAYKETIDTAVRIQLRQLGYELYEISYDERQRDISRVVATHCAYISRLPYVTQKVIRLGDRSMPVVTIRESASGQMLQFIGIHLDDRSEHQRLEQVNELIRCIDISVPTVLMGDFNALYPKGGVRLLAAPIVGWFMQKLPGALGSIGGRVHEMAFGTTMTRLINELSLHDADSRRRATATPKMSGFEWLPSIRLLAIDHILASSGIQLSQHRVARDGGADHRAISVTLKLGL